MRILYINYGSQSGVTSSVLRRLRAAGHEVATFDALEGYLYKRALGPFQVPNVAAEPVLAAAAAMLRFGRWWKVFYCHTGWAFDRLTLRCERAMVDARPDAVLQAGVLFAPGRPGGPSYYLLCDHTRAMNEAYQDVPGIEPGIPFESGWRRREADVYRRAAGVFAMSENVKRSLVDVYGVAEDRIHVVGAGPNVEPDGAPPAARRERAFLFVGERFAHKGGPDLLEAFASVRTRRRDAALWMIGGEQPRQAPPGVTLLGRRPPHEVARRYARASAFVLPTLREAFGLSFLEAMSFGLPCIGTDIEAIPEIVVHGETGLLVPPRAPAALAAAMARLLDEPGLARAMGAAGRARAIQRFGWDRAVRRMLDVMERDARAVSRVARAHGALRRMVPKSPAT
jgi:glycosyltransferase involved in cell wall biosynthesis